MSTFINFSNHPSSTWGEKQIQESLKFGEITDIPFPYINADCSEEKIEELVQEYTDKIMSFHPAAVMAQGEFTLIFGVVHKLLENGILVLSGCAERQVEEIGDTKISRFNFVRYRAYRL